jgi:transient receptor potential cation channel subfamily A member 1
MESQSLENLMEVEHLFDNIKTDKEDVLKRYSTHVNVKQLHGENSLHILAENITNDNFDVIFSMMKVLLSHGCNANYPNYDGKTAFFIVLEKIPKLKKRKDILDYFLKHVEVDFYSHRSEEIVEMVMNQKLKFELPEREDIDIAFESMMNLLEESEINRFETLFPFFKATCSDTECYQDCCSSFMEVAVKKSLINIVDLLIDYGIEVNRISKKNSSSNVPPAFLTCSDAKPALLKLFLMHPKIKLTYEDENQKRKTLLHQFFDEQKKQTRSAFRRSDTREMTKNQKTCFDLLMSHPKVSLHLINAHDEDGFSAIHYSVKFKNDYVTLQLLKKGAYIGTIINRIRKSVLEEFLNSTLTTNDRFYDDEEFEVKIDYSFLSPPCQYETFKKGRRKAVKKDQTEVAMPKSEENIKILSCDNHEQYSQEVKSLQKLAESTELQHLLSHPTIASFILLKWNKISFLVYINMIIILTFLLSFIPFAYLCQNLPDDEKSTDFFYIFFQIISAISLLCLIIRELTQAALSVRKYIFNYSNWIDISLMAFAITILVFETTIPNHTSRVLRTVVILLATAEYFNLLGMVPILSISIHTKMFKKVCETFIKSLAFYSMMIIAFAFSFYNLQGDKFVKDMNKLRLNGPDNTTNDIPVTNATRNERFNNFYTVGSSILKSFVMLTGELETSYVSLDKCFYKILKVIFIILI